MPDSYCINRLNSICDPPLAGLLPSCVTDRQTRSPHVTAQKERLWAGTMRKKTGSKIWCECTRILPNILRNFGWEMEDEWGESRWVKLDPIKKIPELMRSPLPTAIKVGCNGPRQFPPSHSEALSWASSRLHSYKSKQGWPFAFYVFFLFIPFALYHLRAKQIRSESCLFALNQRWFIMKLLGQNSYIYFHEWVIILGTSSSLQLRPTPLQGTDNVAWLDFSINAEKRSILQVDDFQVNSHCSGISRSCVLYYWALPLLCAIYVPG
jgi:hypothetical protein